MNNELCPLPPEHNKILTAHHKHPSWVSFAKFLNLELDLTQLCLLLHNLGCQISYVLVHETPEPLPANS